MTQNQVQVVAEQPSDVSLQGDIIRNRVPAGITQAAGGEVGDAINWQVLSNGSQVWIQGVVVKGAAQGRKGNLPQQKSAAPKPPKTASKKSAKKGSGKKGKAGASFEDAFAMPATPVAAVLIAPVAPPKGGKKKAGYQVPAVVAPIVAPPVRR